MFHHVYTWTFKKIGNICLNYIFVGWPDVKVFQRKQYFNIVILHWGENSNRYSYVLNVIDVSIDAITMYIALSIHIRHEVERKTMIRLMKNVNCEYQAIYYVFDIHTLIKLILQKQKLLFKAKYQVHRKVIL